MHHPRLTAQMNPLKWKPEHKLALAIALFLGAFAGVLAAMWKVEPYGHVWAYSHFVAAAADLISPQASGWAYNRIRFDYYWLIIALWGLVGAALSGALIYIRQLLRA
jgi:hypothetical protein